ncbi:MAG: hypothetical protein AB1806_08405 [Acidobacteriota bacterium]
MSLDHQISDAIAAATKQISAQIEERLRAVASDIGQAASAERVSIVREIRLAAEAEVARKSQEAVAAVQAEHARRLEEAVAASRADGTRRLEEAMAAARGEHARRLDEAVAAAHAESARSHQSELANLRSTAARDLDTAVQRAKADCLREHDSELSRLRTMHERRLEETIAAARAEAAETLADALQRTRAEADARLAAAVDEARTDARAEVERALVETLASERQAELAQVERIADDIRRLDGARSLTEVLELLTESVAAAAPRVAMFIVRGGRVAGWRLAGFPDEADARSLEFGVDDRGLVSRAVRAARPVSTSDGHDGPQGTVTPFGELPLERAGLAVPVRVGGTTVAVLYADDASAGGHEVPSSWPEVAEILCRHAARCLEVLTVTRAVQPIGPVPDAAPSPRYAPQSRPALHGPADDDDAARRYAKLLVSEIKLYHETAVSQGRRDRNLLDRLRPEIERARRLYEERVPAETRQRMDYFGHELVRTLANGDASLLGGP